MVREGGTKKLDSSGRVKRPNNFWAPFNLWWREKYDATGVRPSVAEMREWYAHNAHHVWPPGTVPSLDDMLKIAKGLRSIEQVQTYFRSYRKGLKTRKDGEPGSPDGGAAARRRRHCAAAPQPAGNATATTFIAALQNAARQYQQYQQQQAFMSSGNATAGAACGDGTTAAAQPGAPNWNFSRDITGAAGMRGEAGPSDDEEDEDEAYTPTFTAAAGATATTATTATATVTASATAAGIPDIDKHMGEVQQAAEGAFEDYGRVEAAGSSDDRMAEPRAQAWMGAQPHVVFPPSAMAHRRTLKAVHHASVGGAPFPGAAVATRQSESSGGIGVGSGSAAATAAVFNPVGGSTGGAGMQTVTCRRTRIRTSAGGALWQQEVLEQVEVGVLPAPGPMQPPPMHTAYGMPPQQPAYPGMPLPELALEDASPEVDAAGMAPPRKQLRCGDRAVVSLGGVDDFAGALMGAEGFDAGSGRAEGQQAHFDAAPEHAGRRLAQSCGGFTTHADHHLRHKSLPQSLMALSDGGATYGAQPASAAAYPPAEQGPAPPPPHVAHAPPPFRAPTGSAYGGAPGAWPPYSHAPHPYHHPGHAPYPTYGYPLHSHAAAYSHMPPPPYGYYAGHPPPPGYPPMPAYHMPHYMPPYGMPSHMYGHYPHPLEACGHPADRPAAGVAPAPGGYAHYPQRHTYHHQPAQRQPATQPPQVRTPNARGPAAGGGTAVPRPVQLLELPPVPCGLESLSHSDLAGLSGLSELGQQAAKEAAADDEVASPDRRLHSRPGGQGQDQQPAACVASPPPRRQQPPQKAQSDAGEEPVALIRREPRGSCPGDNIVVSPSDGGATDGMASLYYQTPKALVAKHEYKDTKARPMTIHVLQEEMVVMPLAGMGMAGEMGEMHSPTASLNLLDNLGGEDGMEVAGMWGPVA